MCQFARNAVKSKNDQHIHSSRYGFNNAKVGCHELGITPRSILVSFPIVRSHHATRPLPLGLVTQHAPSPKRRECVTWRDQTLPAKETTPLTFTPVLFLVILYSCQFVVWGVENSRGPSAAGRYQGITWPTSATQSAAYGARGDWTDASWNGRGENGEISGLPRARTWSLGKISYRTHPDVKMSTALRS